MRFQNLQVNSVREKVGLSRQDAPLSVERLWRHRVGVSPGSTPNGCGCKSPLARTAPQSWAAATQTHSLWAGDSMACFSPTLGLSQQHRSTRGNLVTQSQQDPVQTSPAQRKPSSLSIPLPVGGWKKQRSGPGPWLTQPGRKLTSRLRRQRTDLA